jgi:hypothetical protein
LLGCNSRVLKQYAQKQCEKLPPAHHLSPSANHKSPSVISGAIAAMLRSTYVCS